MRTSVFLTGVGGQGILSFARVLGELALIKKVNVLMSETHGMAQRGGSVVATVRMGEAYSPMIGKGRADLLVGLEPLEAARYADMISPEGAAVVNIAPIIPYSVSAMKTKYPPIPTLLGALEEMAALVIAFDAIEVAQKVSFTLAANSAIMGAVAATGRIDATPDEFKRAIKKVVPRKSKENLVAFDLGFEIGRKAVEERAPRKS